MSAVRLPLVKPYDVDWTLDFLRRRAVAGLERVDGCRYSRATVDGVVTVRFCEGEVEVHCPPAARWDVVEARVRALLDLDCEPHAVSATLAREPMLAALVRARPGLRVPGAWDPFELAVRAVLGQLVSVARGTRLVETLVERAGAHLPDGGRAFPSPAAMLDDGVAALGIPRRRGEALRAIAGVAQSGELAAAARAPAALRTLLTGVPGVGPWTREYVAMRAGRDRDAFPEGDWVVRRVLGATAAGARRRAEAWRPHRAYAVMYLWAAAAGPSQG
jgi:AraC family transcriptional regulator of adaptative response / DNA-3-methyladenine glycosylase II